jgi:hypothetical protein
MPHKKAQIVPPERKCKPHCFGYPQNVPLEQIKIFQTFSLCLGFTPLSCLLTNSAIENSIMTEQMCLKYCSTFYIADSGCILPLSGDKTER